MDYPTEPACQAIWRCGFIAFAILIVGTVVYGAHPTETWRMCAFGVSIGVASGFMTGITRSTVATLLKRRPKPALFLAALLPYSGLFVGYGIHRLLG